MATLKAHLVFREKKRKREGEERGGKGKEGKVKCSEKILEERMKDSD